MIPDHLSTIATITKSQKSEVNSRRGGNGRNVTGQTHRRNTWERWIRMWLGFPKHIIFLNIYTLCTVNSWMLIIQVRITLSWSHPCPIVHPTTHCVPPISRQVIFDSVSTACWLLHQPDSYHPGLWNWKWLHQAFHRFHSYPLHPFTTILPRTLVGRPHPAPAVRLSAHQPYHFMAKKNPQDAPSCCHQIGRGVWKQRRDYGNVEMAQNTCWCHHTMRFNNTHKTKNPQNAFLDNLLKLKRPLWHW